MTTYAVVVTATNICDNVVVWDHAFGPWTPPADHYIVDIDGLEVGIGYYYDPATQTWTGLPTISASFNPSPLYIGSSTTLTWDTPDGAAVTLSTNPGESFPADGSIEYTPAAIGKFSVTVTAVNMAGTTSTTVTTSVVALGQSLGEQ
jgi:hypothetical protein